MDKRRKRLGEQSRSRRARPEFSALIGREMAKVATVVKESGMRVD